MGTSVYLDVVETKPNGRRKERTIESWKNMRQIGWECGTTAGVVPVGVDYYLENHYEAELTIPMLEKIIATFTAWNEEDPDERCVIADWDDSWTSDELDWLYGNAIGAFTKALKILRKQAKSGGSGTTIMVSTG